MNTITGLFAQLDFRGWMFLAIGAVVLLTIVVRKIRATFPVQKDPQRLFTNAQRQSAFARAGNRCEAKPLLRARCRRIPNAGDHIYPHSRGGATVDTNLAALCSVCNLRKSARIPSRGYRRRLAKRRMRYGSWPAAMNPEVDWKIRSGSTPI